MSVSTIGYLKGKKTPTEIVDYIRKTYDKTAFHDVKKRDYGSLNQINEPYKLKAHARSKKNWTVEAGFIYFNDGMSNRSLFYIYDNVLLLSDLNDFKARNPQIDPTIMNDFVYLSLGYWGDSVYVMSDLIFNLGGGIIKENDSDDIGFSYVNTVQYRLQKSRRKKIN